MSPSRIDELRRRVQNDPASIAFAQLAEEYRRSGQTDEAVRICREGLVRHPGYLSARVTLGRALLDLGQMAEARGEFEFVVAEAPENLAAVRGLAEIFHRDGQIAEALSYYERALALARHDPEIEEIVQQLSRQIGVAASGPPGGLSFEEAHQELLSAAERVPLAPQSAPPPPSRNATEGSTAPFDFDRLVAALGSPAAPPQLEAAVEGRAVPAIELPEPVDLGPNPFAALEAELRAHELPAPVAAAEPVGPEPEAAPDPAWEPAAVGENATEGSEPDAFPAPSAAADEIVAGDDTVAEPPPSFAEYLDDAAPLTAASVLEDTMLGDSAEFLDGPTALSEAAAQPAAEVTPDPAARPEPGPASAPSEDVLGDLETWLNTLHDRSTE